MVKPKIILNQKISSNKFFNRYFSYVTAVGLAHQSAENLVSLYSEEEKI